MTAATSDDLTVPELAAEWRCSEDTVRRLIRAGDLRAEFIAGRWHIDRRDVANFRKDRENVARRRRRAIT